MKSCDKTKDIPLQFALDDTQDTILNYCNLKELPVALETTAYRMAMDLYRNESPGEESTPLGTVSSISEGDASTSFKSPTTEFKDHLLKDYKAQLRRFRKVGFR
ncbi:head-tail connector protein [Lachnoclostridium phytofermentans]|uniref:hypothetical protein n=1 Tax=Lachnoclostridium phytofermentans TaxID=66219 RepID=UPI002E8E4206|nr:hypothetical protein [Lachnoclostridium phytofermentans]